MVQRKEYLEKLIEWKDDESSRNDKNRIKAVCDYYADSFEKAADWGHHLLSL